MGYSSRMTISGFSSYQEYDWPESDHQEQRTEHLEILATKRRKEGAPE